MKHILSGALLSLVLIAVAAAGGFGLENIIVREISGGGRLEMLGRLDNLDIKMLGSIFAADAGEAAFENGEAYGAEIAEIYGAPPDEPLGDGEAYLQEAPPDSRLAIPPGRRGDDGRIIVRVFDHIAEEVLEMCLEEYLVGVVFSEMPASFELEALKAQAVAARSYSIYKMLNPREADRARHMGADVCTDFRHCKAHMSRAEANRRYGDIEYFWQRVALAVNETAGEIIAYGGAPVIAVFHAMSGSATESAENVWGRHMPHLVAVPTKEADNRADVRNFESESRFSADDFRDILVGGGFGADFAADPGDWLEYTSANDSGRVGYARILGESIPGVRLRALFALRSTDFRLDKQDGYFIFNVYGYGHGVGMSQVGANLMARGGSSYTDILKWYYTGTELININLLCER